MIKLKVCLFLIVSVLSASLWAENSDVSVKPATDKKIDVSKEKETIKLEQPPALYEDKLKDSPFKNAFKKYRKDSEDRKNAAEHQPDTEKKKFGPGITKPKEGEELTSMGISPWRGLGALLIVAVLLGAFFYFLKKVGRKFTGTETNAMTVKSRLQLDSKNSMVIVRAYDEEFLVGVSPNGVNLISRFMPIDSPEQEEEEENKTPIAAAPEFPAKLKSIINSEDISPIKDKKL